MVPDGPAVEAALREAVGSDPEVVLTTGGTGLTPTDGTPEATLAVLDRQAPGIAEAIRAAGVAAGVPTAMLSEGRRVGRPVVQVNCRAPRGARRAGCARAGAGPRRLAGSRRRPLMPAWPVVLHASTPAGQEIELGALRRADHREWQAVRAANRAWLGSGRPPERGRCRRCGSGRSCGTTTRRRAPGGCCRSSSAPSAGWSARCTFFGIAWGSLLSCAAGYWVAQAAWP